MLAYLIVPLILVMSAFIAYLGDYLGRTLGKRRLMLWGMRPKHTAIVITVATGGCIAIITLGSIMAVDTDVRRALLLFPVVQAELDHARTQVTQTECQLNASYQSLAMLKADEAQEQQRASEAGLQEQSALKKLHVAESRLSTEIDNLKDVEQRKQELQQANDALRRQNSALQIDSQNQRVQLTSADLQIRQQTGRLDALGNRLSSQASRLFDLNRRELQFEKEIHQLQTAVSNAQFALRQAEQARQQAETRRDQVRAQLANSQSQLDKATGDLYAAQQKVKDLAAQAQDLQTKNASLTSANTDLEAESGRLRVQNGSLLERNLELAGKNKQAQGELQEKLQFEAETQFSVTKSLEEWYDSTHNAITYEPDQLIAQAVIDCSQPLEKIGADLNDLLLRAGAAARKAGAGDRDSPGQVFQVLDPDSPLDPSSVVRNRFVETLSLHHDKVLVRVQALRRCFAGDQAVGGLHALPYVVVYKKDQIIATTPLDGHQSERVLRNEIATFLASAVRPAALKAGLLPDEHNQVSADLLDKILELSHDVHARDRPVDVDVMAASDTYCSDSLDLEFQIR